MVSKKLVLSALIVVILIVAVGIIATPFIVAGATGSGIVSLKVKDPPNSNRTETEYESITATITKVQWIPSGKDGGENNSASVVNDLNVQITVKTDEVVVDSFQDLIVKSGTYKKFYLSLSDVEIKDSDGNVIKSFNNMRLLITFNSAVSIETGISYTLLVDLTYNYPSHSIHATGSVSEG